MITHIKNRQYKNLNSLITFTVITALLCQNISWAGGYVQNKIKLDQSKLAPVSLFKLIEENSSNKTHHVLNQKRYRAIIKIDKFLADSKTRDHVFYHHKLPKLPSGIDDAFFKAYRDRKADVNGNIAAIQVELTGKPATLYFLKEPLEKEDESIGIRNPSDLRIANERLYWFEFEPLTAENIVRESKAPSGQPEEDSAVSDSVKTAELVSEFDVPPNANLETLHPIAQDIIGKFIKQLEEQTDLWLDAHYMPIRMQTISGQTFLIGNKEGTQDDFGSYINLGVAIHNSVDAIADEAERQGTTYKGRITLRIRIEINRVIVELDDNGTGIPHNVLERLFKKFPFSTKSRDGFHTGKRFGGAGVGISLYGAELLRDCNGTLEFDTRHYDTGAYLLRCHYSSQGIQHTIQEGYKESQGTTVRWIFPEPEYIVLDRKPKDQTVPESPPDSPDPSGALRSKLLDIIKSFGLPFLASAALALSILTIKMHLYPLGYNYIQAVLWRHIFTIAVLTLLYVLPKHIIKAKSQLKANGGRITLGSVISAGISGIKDEIVKDWKLIAFLGIQPRGLVAILTFAALVYTSAFNVSLFLASTTIIVLVINIFIILARKSSFTDNLLNRITRYSPERPKGYHFLSAFLASFGVLFALGGLSTGLTIGFAGITLLLLSNVLFGANSIYINDYSQKLKKKNQTYDPISLVSYSCFIGIVPYILLAAGESIFTGANFLSLIAPITHYFDLGLVVLFALLYQVFSYTALKYSKPANYHIIIASFPIFTILFAYLFYGGGIYFFQIIGAIIVIAGIALFNKKAKPPDESQTGRKSWLKSVGLIGKWEPTVKQYPSLESPYLLLDLAEIAEEGEDSEIREIKEDVRIKCRKLTNKEKTGILSQINYTLISKAEEMARSEKREHILGILYRIKSVINDIWLIHDHPDLQGYGDKKGIFVNERIFYSEAGLAALFHEAGHSYFDSYPRLFPHDQKASVYSSVHQYLRGIGKKERKGRKVSVLSSEEKGLQDELFGEDNLRLTEEIRMLRVAETKKDEKGGGGEKGVEPGSATSGGVGDTGAHLPIERERDKGYTDEGEFLISSLVPNIGKSILEKLREIDPSLPEVAVLYKAVLKVIRFYRRYGEKNISDFRVSFYKRKIRPASVNKWNADNICIDVDLLKIPPVHLTAFLVFIAGHEGGHSLFDSLNEDESEPLVLFMDALRFRRLMPKAREAVISAFRSLKDLKDTRYIEFLEKVADCPDEDLADLIKNTLQIDSNLTELRIFRRGQKVTGLIGIDELFSHFIYSKAEWSVALTDKSRFRVNKKVVLFDERGRTITDEGRGGVNCKCSNGLCSASLSLKPKYRERPVARIEKLLNLPDVELPYEEREILHILLKQSIAGEQDRKLSDQIEDVFRQTRGKTLRDYLIGVRDIIRDVFKRYASRFEEFIELLSRIYLLVDMGRLNDDLAEKIERLRAQGRMGRIIWTGPDYYSADEMRKRLDRYPDLRHEEDMVIANENRWRFEHFSSWHLTDKRGGDAPSDDFSSYMRDILKREGVPLDRMVVISDFVNWTKIYQDLEGGGQYILHKASSAGTIKLVLTRAEYNILEPYLYAETRDRFEPVTGECNHYILESDPLSEKDVDILLGDFEEALRKLAAKEETADDSEGLLMGREFEDDA